MREFIIIYGITSVRSVPFSYKLLLHNVYYCYKTFTTLTECFLILQKVSYFYKSFITITQRLLLPQNIYDGVLEFCKTVVSSLKRLSLLLLHNIYATFILNATKTFVLL